MQFEYKTSRLHINILDETDAAKVLKFYIDGKDTFEPFEPIKPDDYYTEDFHEMLLKGEYQAFLRGSHARYYVFASNNPDEIIGTVSFSNIIPEPYRSCLIGYKFLPEFQKKGYAIESISELIGHFFEEGRLHRIEALIHPDNKSSVSLALRLGFEFEGIARSVARLYDGKYEDHYRYVLLNHAELT